QRKDPPRIVLNDGVYALYLTFLELSNLSLKLFKHHSHTFPDKLYIPKLLGGKLSTGAVFKYPSSLVLIYGNFPCQILHTYSPPGFNSSPQGYLDRKSTRLNSSHVSISYAVFCLKKK